MPPALIPAIAKRASCCSPAVGVNFIIAEGVGIVGQVDYRRTFFDEPDDVEDSINNHLRVFIGARMILD